MMTLPGSGILSIHPALLPPPPPPSPQLEPLCPTLSSLLTFQAGQPYASIGGLTSLPLDLVLGGGEDWGTLRPSHCPSTVHRALLSFLSYHRDCLPGPWVGCLLRCALLPGISALARPRLLPHPALKACLSAHRGAVHRPKVGGTLPEGTGPREPHLPPLPPCPGWT